MWASIFSSWNLLDPVEDRWLKIPHLMDADAVEAAQTFATKVEAEIVRRWQEDGVAEEFRTKFRLWPKNQGRTK